MAIQNKQSKESKKGNGKKRKTIREKTLFTLINELKTEFDCVDFIKKVLYPNGVLSPYTWEKIDHAVPSSNHLIDYKCPYTENSFSILRDTIFSNTKIPLKIWLFTIYDMAASRHGLTAPEITGKYGVSDMAAKRMLTLIRLCVGQAFRNMKLSGLVDVDEKYYGGREKNRSYDKKLSNPHKDGKIPVIGFAEKRPVASPQNDKDDFRRVRMVALDPYNYPDGANEDVIRKLAGECTTEDCMYFTDSSSLYDWMDGREDMLHRRSSHQNGIYSQNGEDSNTIEGHFGWVFPVIAGIHRAPSRIRLQLYLDMMNFLTGTRDMSVYERFLIILKYARLNKNGMYIQKMLYWLDENGDRKQGRPVELVNRRHVKASA
ncbi:IS1595 family transposase [Phocaeicola sp.]|uniref:IS1595 family transposase n=1 Tax=Phocaeicola sp. TaxID=2773926 RepID=UPI0023D525DA|nr:IS1595 family transposase [Phocaeicola sp.]MDE5678335.1 IS1595 family transposase [Phocaeicola sp.]